MTTHDEPTGLTKLWELSDGGKAEWWPDRLRRGTYTVCTESVCFDFSGWHYVGEYESEGVAMDIDEPDALHIVKGHAEDWLRGRGWECVHLAYNKGENYWCKEDWNLKGVDSLPEAILAEVGRGG